MIGHGAIALAELIGLVSIVLLALAGTAAALQSGRPRTPAPVPVELRSDYLVEEMLLVHFARGDIDAQQYHDLLDRAVGGRR
jgi:hypothetical protein